MEGVVFLVRYISNERTNKLKALLVSSGICMENAAEQMQMSRATLSSRINGQTDFTRREMETFAKIVNGNPNLIFFGP